MRMLLNLEGITPTRQQDGPLLSSKSDPTESYRVLTRSSEIWAVTMALGASSHGFACFSRRGWWFSQPAPARSLAGPRFAPLPPPPGTQGGCGLQMLPIMCLSTRRQAQTRPPSEKRSSCSPGPKRDRHATERTGGEDDRRAVIDTGRQPESLGRTSAQSTARSASALEMAEEIPQRYVYTQQQQQQQQSNASQQRQQQQQHDAPEEWGFDDQSCKKLGVGHR
ncbi:hypothetical protein QBC47DRAFT_74212 [Echria macrotheca]|uniref:Uncharacterized protein n=1 Tax=Echria macrotheca TaxID=438768 RepID=A0AAJ0F5T9_9PEZI|nr:hypothetical protein QBC47DRAFT_74212 [Echria macrotheca]